MSDDWAQCVTIWDAYRFHRPHPPLPASPPPDGRGPAESMNAALNQNPTIQSMERLYGISHLLTVFWLPLAILSVCYVVIAAKLIRLSFQSFSSLPTTVRLPFLSLFLFSSALTDCLSRR